MKKSHLIMIVAGVFLLSAIGASAQGLGNDVFVRLNQIISNAYPRMTAYVSVTDDTGRPAELRPDQVAVYVDDVKVRGSVGVRAARLSAGGTAYAVIISANGMNNGPPLYNEQFATKMLLDSLSPDDVVSVYFHGSEVKSVFEYQPMSAQKGQLRAVIDKDIEAKGSQPQIYDAIVAAATNLQASNKTRKVIILMSDGRDEKSNYTQDETFQIIEKVNIPVYCIGFSAFGEGNLDALEKIARYTGGLYTLARDVKDIPDAMTSTYNAINQVYEIAFKDNKFFFSGDGKPHLLKVTIEGSTGSVHAYDRKFIAVSTPIPAWVFIVAALVFLLIVALIVFLVIMHRTSLRKSIGTLNRTCDVCGRRMKDDWDECMFCKWLPASASKKRRGVKKPEVKKPEIKLLEVKKPEIPKVGKP